MPATRVGRLKVRRIPKNPDLSGVVRIQGSSPFWDALRIDDIPPATDAYIDPINKPGVMRMRPRGIGACGTPYRVALPAPEGWASKKLPTRSFVLSSEHTNATLYFLAEFWRQAGVPFIGITNKHGNMFKPAIYQGSGLAYLCH